MSLGWNIGQKNYTTDITPKMAVTSPIHIYARFNIDTEGFPIYSGNYSIEADLVSYHGTENPWYPCLVMCISRNGEGRIGCYFSPGFGEYENISVVRDGEHSSTFTDVGITVTDTTDMTVDVFDTNLPIVFRYDSYPYMVESTKFEDWINYDEPGTMPDVILENVYNLREIVPEDFEDWWTNVTKGNYTITASGKTLNGSNTYAWEKIKTRKTDRGKIAWALSSDGKTATLVMTKTAVEDVWSDSKGYQWIEAASPHFLSLPYEWDGVTLGTYDISSSFKYGVDTNIPVFDNKDIQAYLDGDKDITDSKGYSGTNKTGDEETTTEFPDVEMNMNSVSSLIAMNSSGLSQLNATIFDIDDFITESDIISSQFIGAITGTTLATVLPAVVGLMNVKAIDMFNSVIYFPFDVTTIASTTSISTIYSGLRHIQAPTGSKLITANNGFLNLGSVTVSRTWFDYRDLTNMRCKLYLPYIGYRTLNLNEILGKSVNVRYYVDLYSGGCVAAITANNRLIDYAQGLIGVNMGVTPDSANGLFNSTATIVASAATENYFGAAAGAIGAVNQLATGGSSCPANGLGLHLPQYAFFVFESDNINETANEVSLDGKPSDVSASIGSFSGYLKVKSVDLHCSGATDNEKEMIKSLLQSGIYI